VWMQLSRDPESFWYSEPAKGRGWNISTWSTPFSGFRWAIPAACGYTGKAIYADSDMIAMADIAELWGQEFRNNAAVISKGMGERFCVSLFDCGRMQKHLPPIDELKSNPQAFRQARRLLGGAVQPFAGNWNCLDGEGYADIRDPKIKMLHYTAIPTQLHLKYSLPRLIAEGGKHWFTGRPQEHPRRDFQALFDEMLAEAIAHGYPPERYRKEPFGDYRIRWAA